ncbi:MAG: transcription elongation GreA/GreB family factor [Myxococcota bacterium]|jgi:transcription elongation GreA/GreB family factor
MNKATVLTAIRQALAVELAAHKQTVAAALDEATGEESRPENQYDTRSLEASYLAGALADRLSVLRQLCGFFEAWKPQDFTENTPLAVGALVQLTEEDDEWLCLLVPRGGRKVTFDGITVTLLSPGAPLGAALMGCEEGDEVDFSSPRGVRSVEVSAVW